MPTYEYACPACGAFDQLRPLSQRDEATACPKCGETAQRLISAPGVATGLHGAGSRDSGGYVRLKHAAGCPCC